MVDAVVSFVVERIGDYLIREAVFLREVRKEVELLKNELEWMQCFIKDAEEKKVDDPMIRQWVSDITSIAYDTEDVLDKYLLKIVRNGPEKPGFLSSIKMCTCFSERCTMYSVGNEIENLRKRLNDLARKRETYGLESIGNERGGRNNTLGRLKQLRRATSFAVEESVVGFEDDANKLLTKLVDNEPGRFVISIFGMGGLGKTTLARKLDHSSSVRTKFDCFAWVCVSQEYTTEDLLLRIIGSFNFMTRENLEKMKEEELERCLRRYLQGRSYLMVIDDVWQKEVWEGLKRAFPDDNECSRVIVTTRNKVVAERLDEKIHFHQLGFLSPNESWQLFCDKAFRKQNVDQGLEKLGREMLQKCGGLPLAIVVLGGLLSTKKPQEWRVVRDHIWGHLRSDSIHISHLLALSFSDLSYQLKLCFLYLGIFPEDYEINAQKVIRLLVAEGLIPQNEDRTMEEVAEDNLHELINRSLIQVGKNCWGRIATCRVHDLLRDLAIQKAKELHFIHIYDQIKMSSTSSPACRREAAYIGIKHLALQHCNPLSRSVLLFNQRWDGRYDDMALHLAPLCTKFTLLRVLDVEPIEVTGTRWWRANSLPNEVGTLIHLKYLGLRNSHICNLPESIFKLQRLQTLDLSTTAGYLELPIEISKLKELRHLIGKFEGNLPIENLTNLQTLKCAVVESWNKINPAKLINLRELHLEEEESKEGKVFTFDSIATLKSLQILSIKLIVDNSFASPQPLFQCPRLVDLRLRGRFETLPGDMHDILPNLECLSLENSFLRDDPMPALEKMPNLVILDLRSYSYYGKKLMCTAKGFPRLEILQLHVNELENWQIEEGAMPRLRGLRIPMEFRLRIPKRLRSIPPPAGWECDEHYSIEESLANANCSSIEESLLYVYGDIEES